MKSIKTNMFYKINTAKLNHVYFSTKLNRFNFFSPHNWSDVRFGKADYPVWHALSRFKNFLLLGQNSGDYLDLTIIPCRHIKTNRIILFNLF